MHQWSTTPLNNQTADSRANWQEGQPASSLNNSARGLMATAAFWRDDNLGTLVATLGASNVYTVTTGQGLIDPATTAGGGTGKISHPFSLRVVLPAMNTAVAATAPTIVIDSAAAVPLVRRDGTALVDGDLTGVPQEILGDTVTSGAISRVRVLNLLPSDVKALAPAPSTQFPIGGILPFTGGNTPAGFVVANGAWLSRTSYPLLWAHAQASGILTDDGTWSNNFGYQGWYSTADGSANFRIPALNGVFLRGLDSGRGLDPNRTMGTTQNDAFRSHTHGLTGGGYVFQLYGSGPNITLATGNEAPNPGAHAVNIANSGDSETRPYNVAYPFLIRAY